MSSKVIKKDAKGRRRLKTKDDLSDRNRAIVEQLQQDEGYIERFTRVFSKWRLITYFSVIFLPPYGLYRVWSKESNFQKSEKGVWTMMIVVYMIMFVYNYFIA